MAREKRGVVAEETPGAPEWMVTFSDCMTLLLTFFVLLLSFSSFDDKIYRQMRETVFKDLPTVYRAARRNRDALARAERVNPKEELPKGSEKPTLEQGPEGGMKQDADAKDFSQRKVFVIASDKVFWGKGSSVSSQGRRTLATMARFLERVHGQIVISENQPEAGADNKEPELTRAFAVMKYLTTKHALDSKRFCITAASTISKREEPSLPITQGQCRLEISILERSICN